MPIKEYNKTFVRIFPEIFQVQSHFLPTFGGGIQLKDGITSKDVFMELKTVNADVTMNDYSMDENVAFGTGTGNTTRFGQRKEIKAVDTQVKYEKPLAIHEGIDRFTVNDNEQQVITERLVKHSEAWTEYINGLLSKELSAKASKELTGQLDEAGVTKVFSDAHAEFVNSKINPTLTKRAYVTPQVYNIIIESKLATTAKQSGANIDEQTITKFKGFVIHELPESYFQAGEQIYFAVDNIGVVGLGIEVIRTFESEDFSGVALQGAAKYAKFIPDANVKGILKAKLGA